MVVGVAGPEERRVEAGRVPVVEQQREEGRVPVGLGALFQEQVPIALGQGGVVVAQRRGVGDPDRDPDRFELVAQERGHRLVQVGGGVAGDEGQLERAALLAPDAVGPRLPAGRVEELARLARVVRVALDLGGVRSDHHRGDVGLVPGALSAKRFGDQPLAIDGEGDGLADVHVRQQVVGGKALARRVQGEVRSGDLGRRGGVAGLGQPGRVHLRDGKGDVDLAGLQGPDPVCGPRVEGELDAGGSGFGAPVVGIALDHDPLALLVLDQAEGARPHRLGGVGAGGVDARARVGQHLGDAEVGDGRGEIDRHGVDDLGGVGPCAELASAGSRDPVEQTGLHGRRVERFAVVELHAGPDVEPPRVRCDEVPFLRQQGLELQVRGQPDQRLDGAHVERGHADAAAGRGVVVVGGEAHAQRVPRRPRDGGLRVPAAAGAARRGRHEQQAGGNRGDAAGEHTLRWHGGDRMAEHRRKDINARLRISGANE